MRRKMRMRTWRTEGGPLAPSPKQVDSTFSLMHSE